MDWTNVIIMGVGLAMDCCAISAVQGLNQGKWHPKALLMALIFGCFHMGMPIVGYFAGSLFVFGSPTTMNMTKRNPPIGISAISCFWRLLPALMCWLQDCSSFLIRNGSFLPL